VGGGGERVTLRLVARYADACNVFGGPDTLRHKFEVLRRHCEAEGRDYATIERTNLTSFAISANGGDGTLSPAEMVDRLGAIAEAGAHHVIFSLRGVHDLDQLELIGREVLPKVKGMGEPSPIP
jgi:alkanesulfonate monooxygenase SsuD/methylene tetrahydromethanopterin reductase-like flavin-dependent oxidoreductase (luciferase family)